MRLLFIDPPQAEVDAVAIDLIMRFGLKAHDEALHLADVASRMHARRNRHLYRHAACPIEQTLADSQTRLNGAPTP